MKQLFVSFLLSLSVLSATAANFFLQSGQAVTIDVASDETSVVETAVSLLERDMKVVLNVSLNRSDQKAQIVIGTFDPKGKSPIMATLKRLRINATALGRQTQAFLMTVSADGQLIIVGSDPHGTAYGIIELTRMLGVSAWEWWADVTPYAKEYFLLQSGFVLHSAPNVLYRGIFINDEDFAFVPWSTATYEPNANGNGFGGNYTVPVIETKTARPVGVKTTEKVFELMLRLRANLYWPPMHECSQPFFLTPGLRELAARYGIYIGTSHCEPMGCNANGEWKVRGEGAYDYVNNRDAVLAFWEERVRETANQPMIYTLGMRGIHDGPMQGASSVEEQKAVLQQVFADQRELITRHVSKWPQTVPQVFIPYKEVLDVYRNGLEVPDDVTLMWCDDNYGYIRHFPTEAEQARSGGNGVYYHVSYWGRPHDYLWSNSASPFLLYQQMSEALYHGASRMWVLNVGDIKPLEYQISLFMDMAWDLDSVRNLTVSTHLERWFAQTVHPNVARLTSIYMKKYYNYVFQCKPEHMAGTRTEEQDPKWTQVQDLPWSETKLRKRLTDYDRLSRELQWLADSVRKAYPERYDAFYELAEYPLMTGFYVNEKYCTAQLARHGKTYLAKDNVQSTWLRSDHAHQAIQEMTDRYNNLRGGKWRGMMNASPRDLTVFKPIPHEQVGTPLPTDLPTIATFYGASFQASSFSGGSVLSPVLGLGASIRAMPLPKDCNVTYKFRHDFKTQEYVQVELHMLPTHPIEAEQRVTVSLDGCSPLTLTYEQEGRNEMWKQNVLRGYAVVLARLPITRSQGEHTLVLSALDDGVVVDYVKVLK